MNIIEEKSPQTLPQATMPYVDLVRPDFRTKARQARLRIALAVLKADQLNTAAGLLLDLYRRDTFTPEGAEAAIALAALVDAHEAAGRFHMTLDLYARILGEGCGCRSSQFYA